MLSTNLVKKFSSRKKFIFIIVSIILAVSFLSSCSANQVEDIPTGPFSYSKDVAPIFANHCVKCHGSEMQEGQLDLSSYTALMAGGKSGEIISPGNADNSKLISLVMSGKMPKKGVKLTPDQIRILTDWVNAGAQDN
ncbi:MAG: c-type cytochrome domain-containing protein [Chloroflexota bacterium]